MYTPPSRAAISPHVRRQRSDTLARCLVEYRQALDLLTTRTPAGAEALRDYMTEAVQLMEAELRSRGEDEE